MERQAILNTVRALVHHIKGLLFGWGYYQVVASSMAWWKPNKKWPKNIFCLNCKNPRPENIIDCPYCKINTTKPSKKRYVYYLILLLFLILSLKIIGNSPTPSTIKPTNQQSTINPQIQTIAVNPKIQPTTNYNSIDNQLTQEYKTPHTAKKNIDLDKIVHVNSYTKSNGTHVQTHIRSKPQHKTYFKKSHKPLILKLKR